MDERSRHQPCTAVAAVSAQAILLTGLAWPVRPPPHPRTLRWIGRVISGAGLVIAGVAAAGLGPALTPSPLPSPQAQLRRDGMFERVRHPIYSGLLLLGAGRLLTAGRRRVAPAVALTLLLAAKARWEERLMSTRFPDYPSYAATTPRFIPAMRRSRK